jgi:asparagine synthase (glutamine-hydrolysing)
VFRDGLLASIGGRSRQRPSRTPIAGLRTAQQDTYDALGQARARLYSDGMWDRLDDHLAYADLDITNDRIGRWHPLNQSLYVGYKVMLAGLLLQAKGDRIAMNSSVETRYPFLDDDVISFCAGIDPSYKLRGLTEKWLLRQVAARTLPKAIANRRKTMFRASRAETFLAPDRPAWVDQLLSPESLRATGYFDPQMIARERARQMAFPRITPRRLVLDLSLTCAVSTQLWHHTFCGGGLCDLPTWSPVASSPALDGPYTDLRPRVGAPLPVQTG